MTWSILLRTFAINNIIYNFGKLSIGSRLGWTRVQETQRPYAWESVNGFLKVDDLFLFEDWTHADAQKRRGT
jgi:hypothetical protein